MRQIQIIRLIAFAVLFSSQLNLMSGQTDTTIAYYDAMNLAKIYHENPKIPEADAIRILKPYFNGEDIAAIINSGNHPFLRRRILFWAARHLSI